MKRTQSQRICSGARLAFAALLAIGAGLAWADDPLTPIGAERAGNADGSIPPWEGGITRPPANYDASHHCVDPFPNDTPLFTIDATNVNDYADRLSAGQRALFAAFPDTWRMHVYPTAAARRIPNSSTRR